MKKFRWVLFVFTAAFFFSALSSKVYISVICLAFAALLIIPVKPFGNLIKQKIDQKTGAETRRIISIVLAAVLLISGFIPLNHAGKRMKENQEREPRNPVTTTSTSAVETTTTTVTTVTVQTTTESKFPTDISILTAEGHPTYYGSMSSAHLVWDTADSRKISFDESNRKRHAIIYLDSRSSNTIHNIEVYFNHSKELNDISLDDALRIASSYLPYDILSRYYDFSDSYCVSPKDENHEETYYVVSYRLNESGKSTDYDGSVDIIFELSKKNKANYFSIGFGTPRWMNRLDFNGYEEVKWQYNFLESTVS